MRRVIVFVSLLTLAVLLGVSTAHAAPAQRGPQPATIRAKTASDTGAPGALVPVAGTLRDAKHRPLTGVPVTVAVAGAPQVDELQLLTGSGGDFEVYVPLPDAMPASGTVDLVVSFQGTADVAPTSVTLPVRVESAPQAVAADLQKPAGPAPAATLPGGHGSRTALPTSGSPLIDQLIMVASGLLGVMVVLFGIGALLRRRRRS
jgi:hypothetical protein